MLRKIHIERFRSCEDVRIDMPDHLIALVGRNGAGKTNILKAMEWLAQSSTPGEAPAEYGSVTIETTLAGADLQYHVQTTPGKGPAGRREWLKVKQDELWATIFDRDDKALRIAERQEPLQISATASSLPAIAALLPGAKTITGHVNNLLEFLRTVRYYPADEPADPHGGEDYMPFIWEDAYKKWRTAYTSDGVIGDSVPMRLLHMFLEKKTRFQELSSLLGVGGLGIIDEIFITTHELDSEKEPKGHFYVLLFRPSGTQQRAFPYGRLSMGTRRVLRILVSMLFDKSSLVLLEHPEDGIHSGLMKKLISLLQSNADPGQVLIASHSADVFNKLQPQNVRLVTIRDGRTSVRSLTAEEVRIAQDFVSEEGSLADFLETIEED